MHAEAGADDAEDIGGDGDGDTGQGQQDAASGGAFEEVAVEDGEGEEAHERTDSATGLRDLELHDGKLDDVAFEQDRDAEHGEDLAGDAGGKELEGEGDLVEDDGGKGDSEEEDKEGKAELAKHGPSEEGPDDAGGEERGRRCGR